MGRTRSRDFGVLVPTGNSYSLESDGTRTITHQGLPIKGYYESMIDSTSPGPPYRQENFLEHRVTKVDPPTYTIPASSSKTGNKGTDKLIIPGLFQADRPSTPLGIDLQDLENKALAQLNPNNPIVDVPLFLFELKDLPRMLRSLGQILSGRGNYSDFPGSYVAYQFGWRPLFNDLLAFVTLGEQLEAQKNRIDKMRLTSRYGGSLGGSTDQLFGPIKTLSRNNNEYCTVQSVTNISSRYWFSVQLEPRFSSPYWGENNFGAVRRALGLNTSFATIWNAIPWSWFVDYFYSVGSYFEANRGSLPFDYNSMCLMETQVHVEQHNQLSSSIPDLQIHGGRVVTTWKRRWPRGVPAAWTHWRDNPLAGKLSILSALATAKALKALGR